MSQSTPTLIFPFLAQYNMVSISILTKTKVKLIYTYCFRPLQLKLDLIPYILCHILLIPIGNQLFHSSGLCILSGRHHRKTSPEGWPGTSCQVSSSVVLYLLHEFWQILSHMKGIRHEWGHFYMSNWPHFQVMVRNVNTFSL